jgi:hypothetical protein
MTDVTRIREMVERVGGILKDNCGATYAENWRPAESLWDTVHWEKYILGFERA